MGFPLDLAIRYMGSRKRSSISLGTFFAVFGVALGVAGLATAMSVTGGFHRQFRDKVLGVNAHVIVLKRSSYFGEYGEVMNKVSKVPGVTGLAPFTINPMMVTHGSRTATGILLKGIDPARVGSVLALPRDLVEGSLDGLRLPGSKPPAPRGHRTLPSEEEGEKDDPGDGAGFLGTLKRLVEQEAANTGGASGVDVTAPRGAEAKANEEAKAPVDDFTLPDDPAELPEGMPVGSIVPEGGYQAALPMDDVLPSDIDPDPCKGKGLALPGIVIGKTLGKSLDAGLGDCVQVTSPTIGFSFSRDSIRAPVAKQFRVVGIFDAGFEQYDAKFVYTDLFQAQEFYDSGDSVTGVEVKVKDIDAARRVARRIDDVLGGGLYYTMDWEELNHGLFTALRVQQILMSLVLALIIVVAAFTVIATLIMVVMDKKKEIGVMKAMGATDSAILRAFLYQGGIIGAVGGVFGLALGYGVCEGLLRYAVPLDPKVYFISRVPVDVRPLEFVLVGLFAVLVCVLATAWPALYAARLRPSEAFREQ